MKFFTSLLTILLTLGLNNAYAAINSWEQIQSPDQAIYEIEDTEGNSLSINCSTETIH